MNLEGRSRVVIENVRPKIDGGRFPIRRVVGEGVVVQADIFADGHDEVSAVLLYGKSDTKQWNEAPMKLLVNDRWKSSFRLEEIGEYRYTLQAWVDHFETWLRDLRRKVEAGQDVRVDLLIGAGYLEKTVERAKKGHGEKLLNWIDVLRSEKDVEKTIALALSEEVRNLMLLYPDKERMTTYPKELVVVVEREKALFSTWYELFPRSCSPEPGQHGTFKDCEGVLPEISQMGFDVLYLPPIHPVGKTKKKGRDKSPVAGPNDPGSPWAIGSEEGDHRSIHSELGTMEDFDEFASKAKNLGLEIALDLTFQCSHDHPYIREHPEWFLRRPNGTIQYAENPPKKYEDVIPFNFETESWQELWRELKNVVIFWIKKGVRIFRVDNPHTKPFAFWEWLIQEIRKDYPNVIFLSEAFTRPKAMYQLAKVGFSQSYTYFTWRNTKRELTEFLTELTQTDVREYLRPNFWPNTPDILPEFLQYGGRPAFMIRFVLAATLSSNYGIYGPTFELCVTEAAQGEEEYSNSEKYEIRHWDRKTPESLKYFITRVNRIRRENKALHTTSNVRFCEVDNDYLLSYQKATEDLSNTLLIVVNLDPFHTQSGWVRVPLEELGIISDQPYLVNDLVSDDKYLWQGERNYIELNPEIVPAHIFRVHRRLRKEVDFDYYM